MSLLFGFNYFFYIFNERMSDALFVGAILEIFIVLYVLLQKKEKINFFSFKGLQGRIFQVHEHYAMAKINGEIWKVSSDDVLKKDDLVIVIDEPKLELMLKVKKIN